MGVVSISEGLVHLPALVVIKAKCQGREWRAVLNGRMTEGCVMFVIRGGVTT